MRIPPLLPLALGLGLAALGFPVVALYRRLEPHDLLGADTRRRVYEHIARQPGATAADIAASAGCDRKTAAHHARVLHEASFLEAERNGRVVRYFLPGDRSRRPPAGGVAADVLRLALARPGLSQAEAAEALGVCRATVQWHARKLAERGFLDGSRLEVPAARREALQRALTTREDPAS